MPAHVDVVENKWLVGEQVPVARVHAGATGLDIEAPETRWFYVVERALADLESATAGDALDRLSEIFRGSHLFATSPHDETECPFHGWAALPAESVELQQLLAAP